jgi:carnitine-CoA ligase
MEERESTVVDAAGTTGAPAVVGEVIIGKSFVIGRRDVDQFESGTWVDRAYPEGDVPEFPDTLVEGFHLLALVDPVLQFALGDGPRPMWGLNYGLDKVRFVSQVHVGDVVAPRFETLEVQEKDGGFKVLRRCTFTVVGAERPAMVADWWAYQLPRGLVEKGRRG